jgi:hypothetical protein
LTVRKAKEVSLEYRGTDCTSSLADIKTAKEALILEMHTLNFNVEAASQELQKLRETLANDKEDDLIVIKESTDRWKQLRQELEASKLLLEVYSKVEEIRHLPVISPSVTAQKISVGLPKSVPDNLRDQFRGALFSFIQSFLQYYNLKQVHQFVDKVEESDFVDGIPKPLTKDDIQKLSSSYGHKSCGHLKLRAALIASWNRAFPEKTVIGFSRKTLKAPEPKVPEPLSPSLMGLFSKFFRMTDDGPVLMSPEGNVGIATSKLAQAAEGHQQAFEEHRNEDFDDGRSDYLNDRHFGASLNWEVLLNITPEQHALRVRAAGQAYTSGYYCNMPDIRESSSIGELPLGIVEEPPVQDLPKPQPPSETVQICKEKGCSSAIYIGEHYCAKHLCTTTGCPLGRIAGSMMCEKHTPLPKAKKSSVHTHVGQNGLDRCKCGARFHTTCSKWLQLSEKGFEAHIELCHPYEVGEPSRTTEKKPSHPDSRDALIAQLTEQLATQTALIRQLSDDIRRLKTLPPKEKSVPEGFKTPVRNFIPVPRKEERPDPLTKAKDIKGKGKELPLYQPTNCKVDKCTNWSKKGSDYCSRHILNRGVERPKGNRKDLLPDELYQALREHFGCVKPLSKEARDELTSEQKKAYSKAVSVPRWALRAVEQGGKPALDRIVAGNLQAKDVRYNPGPVITRDGALDLWRLTRQKFKSVSLVANPQSAKERQFLNEFQRQRAMHARAGIKGVLPRLGRHLNGETWKQVNERLRTSRQPPPEKPAKPKSTEEKVDALVEAVALLTKLFHKKDG